MSVPEVVSRDATELLDGRRRRQARDVIAELSVVPVGTDATNLTSIIGAIAELADLESVAFYSVRNRAGHWSLDRWFAHGPIDATRDAAQDVFTSSPELPVYYNPLTPPRGQRNRVIDARLWVERTRPGAWDTNPMVERVLAPRGLGRHHQPRALLCDNAALLGWFGAVHPLPPTPQQLATLAMFVEPMRDRIAAEARLRDTPYMRAALDAMLDRLGAPAFVVDAGAAIQEANASGRVLLTNDSSAIGSALRAVIADGVGDGSFELIPIQDGAQRAWIAVRKDTTPDLRIARCIETCRVRWNLTPRQSEVLTYVVRGETNATIAGVLGCVERTVELHITAIFDRAGVDSRAALVAAVLTAVA